MEQSSPMDWTPTREEQTAVRPATPYPHPPALRSDTPEDIIIDTPYVASSPPVVPTPAAQVSASVARWNRQDWHRQDAARWAREEAAANNPRYIHNTQIRQLQPRHPSPRISHLQYTELEDLNGLPSPTSPLPTRRRVASTPVSPLNFRAALNNALQSTSPVQSSPPGQPIRRSPIPSRVELFHPYARTTTAAGPVAPQRHAEAPVVASVFSIPPGAPREVPAALAGGLQPLPRREPESAAPPPSTPRQGVKRKHAEEGAVDSAAGEETVRPSLAKRICRSVVSRILARFSRFVPLAPPSPPSPATRRREYVVPGTWPGSPAPVQVDVEPVPVEGPAPSQEVEEAAEEPAAVVAAESPAKELDQPDVGSPFFMGGPVPLLDGGEYRLHRNPAVEGDARALVGPKKISRMRELLNKSRRALAEYDAQQAAELVVLPGITQAVNDELSFLADAPAPRRERSVRFVESAWFERPYPTNTRYYVPGEAMDHPVSPMGNPAFLGHREGAPASSPASAADTPARPVRMPVFDLSPAATRAPETPAGLSALGEDFSRFHLSAFRQRLRDEREAAKKEVARRAEEDAARAAEELRKVEEAEKLKNKLIKELTTEWTDTIKKAMGIKSKSSDMGQSGLTRKDFGTLLPQRGSDDMKGWLNDEIVNNYLEKMVQKALKKTGYTKKADEVPRFHAFNTNLYNSMVNRGGFTAVARWPQKARIGGKRMLQCDLILVPINSGVHWTLAAISGTKRTIQYYDSMSGAGKDASQYTKVVLDLVAGTLGDAYKPEEWKVIDTSSVQQSNALDCGVFVCMNALSLISGKNPLEAFTAEEMPAARLQVAATLYHGEFTGDFDFDL